MGTFTAHVIDIKILPYAMIVGKNFCILRMCYLIVDRCVTTVEYVRIVYHNRLSVWIKSCFYIDTVLLICLNSSPTLTPLHS